MKIILIITICIFFNACDSNKTADIGTENYGEEVSYSNDRELKFSDFSIKYIGERDVKYPDENSPLSMRIYDFRVSKGEKSKMILWTAGTGELIPTFFEIGGAEYVLDLRSSEILKEHLKDGNLIIWKKSFYDDALKKKNN